VTANWPVSRLSDLDVDNKNIDYQVSTLGNSPLSALLGGLKPTLILLLLWFGVTLQ